ncbi:Holliday junction resolvase RuvX [Atopobacter phocae]|uniref:Holliday junction resolvase RuvX n=1 Tax=Atopobacter phocae TaxID=136492 RepID=UPI00046F5189|nr:Holliday junction resolvase RuvX [Atopobacter phocae]
MRVMGLDVGSKTVGVAISDPFGWTAQGIETIRINENKNQLGIDRVLELIEAYEVDTIVIGLPKNMNNSEGFRSDASRAYGEALSQIIDLPIVYQDERLTTMEAERMLIEQGNVSRQKRKGVIDKLAAVLLLQNYLDQK